MQSTVKRRNRNAPRLSPKLRKMAKDWRNAPENDGFVKALKPHLRKLADELLRKPKLVSAVQPPPARCPSCHIAYTDHLGLHGTCSALQQALRVLRQIRDGNKLPKRLLTQVAGSAVTFIETQTHRK